MLRWYQGSWEKKNRISCSITSGRFEEGELEGGFRISQEPERGRGIREEPVQHGGEHQRTEERGRLSFELTYEKSIHRRERYGRALAGDMVKH